VDWIKCIANRLLRAARHEAGITLIETVFAIAIFGIVAMSLIGVLTSATAADGLARQRSIALELAQQQVEYTRQLDYTHLGVSGGNPNGVVVGTTTKQVMGLWYTLKTTVKWVNDPVSGLTPTSANYKRVRVIVTRKTDNKELARSYAYVSSSTRAPNGGLDYGVINAIVLDNVLNTPLQNVTVTLSNGASPTSTASDVTDENGLVTFPALTASNTPNAAGSYYDILVSLTDYYPLIEDLPPGCSRLQTCTSPTAANSTAENAPAHISLSASEQTNTNTETFKIYKPSSITVNILNSDGSTFTGTATVIIGSDYPRGAQEYTVTGGSLTVARTQASPNDMIGGEYPVSGISYRVGARTVSPTANLFAPLQAKYVPDSGTYPASPSSTFTLTLGSTPIVPKSCTITVRTPTTSGSLVSGARVDAVDGASDPVDSYDTGTTNNPSGQVVLMLPAGTDWDIWASKSGVGTTGIGHLADKTVPSSGTCAFTVPIT
jgi:type II secretory pathway pseudopilin PulG